MKAALIVNPVARGAGEAIAAVLAAGVRLGLEPPKILPTSADHPGPAQARAALASGVERLIVAGGDGTLRNVAGVVAAAGSPRCDTTMAIVPIGAGNLVARNLGIQPRRLDKAADVALTGAPRQLSVGWVSCRVAGLWLPEVPMLVVAGIGRDAEAIATTRPWLKRRAGWLAYAESGGRQALREAMPMSVGLDGEPPQALAAWSVLVAILPRLPMGVVAFPGVEPGTDIAQVLRVDLASPLEWGAVALKGLTHTTTPVKALNYAPASTVFVEPAVPGPVQIDGDLIRDVEQMRVRLQAKAIYVASPEKPGQP